MASQLKLFVFIIGLETPFSVTIESSETVDDLKECILKKKPNQLNRVDADQLSIYRVELADDSTLGQLAAQVVQKEVPLRPSTPLSEIFPKKPLAKTIHIVVELKDIGE
jgi:Crinkler effector protein N-terminal domain